jgi:hypothetical protein
MDDSTYKAAKDRGGLMIADRQSVNIDLSPTHKSRTGPGMTNLKSVNEAVTMTSFENAFALAGELKSSVRHDTPGLTVFAGQHPILGDMSIVIPVSGNSFLIYPFETRA